MLLCSLSASACSPRARASAYSPFFQAVSPSHVRSRAWSAVSRASSASGGAAPRRAGHCQTPHGDRRPHRVRAKSPLPFRPAAAEVVGRNRHDRKTPLPARHHLRRVSWRSGKPLGSCGQRPAIGTQGVNQPEECLAWGQPRLGWQGKRRIRRLRRPYRRTARLGDRQSIQQPRPRAPPAEYDGSWRDSGPIERRENADQLPAQGSVRRVWGSHQVTRRAGIATRHEDENRDRGGRGYGRHAPQPPARFQPRENPASGRHFVPAETAVGQVPFQGDPVGLGHRTAQVRRYRLTRGMLGHGLTGGRVGHEKRLPLF